MSGVPTPRARDVDAYLGRSSNVGTTGVLPSIERSGHPVNTVAPASPARGFIAPDARSVSAPTDGELLIPEAQITSGSWVWVFTGFASFSTVPPAGLLTVSIFDGDHTNGVVQHLRTEGGARYTSVVFVGFANSVAGATWLPDSDPGTWPELTLAVRGVKQS